jgi:hypothetical protein
MSELPMRGHFRYLRFKTFPTTPRTPQCEVFFPLLSSSEHSGVLKDSKSNFSKCWASPPHLAKVGVRHKWNFHDWCDYQVFSWNKVEKTEGWKSFQMYHLIQKGPSFYYILLYFHYAETWQIWLHPWLSL